MQYRIDGYRGCSNHWRHGVLTENLYSDFANITFNMADSEFLDSTLIFVRITNYLSQNPPISFLRTENEIRSWFHYIKINCFVLNPALYADDPNFCDHLVRLSLDRCTSIIIMQWCISYCISACASSSSVQAPAQILGRPIRFRARRRWTDQI
jgi:hypothetical protein